MKLTIVLNEEETAKYEAAKGGSPRMLQVRRLVSTLRTEAHVFGTRDGERVPLITIPKVALKASAG